jgi:hypothetical protein
MKTAIIPATEVATQLREQVEGSLKSGESMSSFLIESLELNLHRRKAREAFITKGLSARKEAKTHNDYKGATDVLIGLRSKMGNAQMSSGQG